MRRGTTPTIRLLTSEDLSVWDRVILLTIETDGTLKCARYSTGASAIAVPNNAWMNLNSTYVSAS